jgi:hypothetical protein
LAPIRLTHILGGSAKPAHKALKTAKDSNCPRYVLLLITTEG